MNELLQVLALTTLAGAAIPMDGALEAELMNKSTGLLPQDQQCASVLSIDGLVKCRFKFVLWGNEMAWRPERLVQTGELDNTQRGWTIGWLQLDGFNNRLQLKLAGNCHPDLAGWKFRINRIEPELEGDEGAPFDFSTISLDQSGHVGDITADQMIKHHDIPDDELVRRLLVGEKPPFTWRKCLYLEWFSNANGRVVIQSTRLQVERLGERAFELTEEEWKEQAMYNAEELNHFMVQLGDILRTNELDEDS